MDLMGVIVDFTTQGGLINKFYSLKASSHFLVESPKATMRLLAPRKTTEMEKN